MPRSHYLSLLISVLGSTLLVTSATGQSAGYYGAGGRRVFQDSDCIGATPPVQCWIAGTHTNVTVQNLTFNLDSSPQSYVYGFGVGHETTRGQPYGAAHNWATYEGGTATPSGRFARTELQRVCSIDGHVRLSAGSYSSRGRRWDYTGPVGASEYGYSSFGVGLAMWKEAGCVVEDHQCTNEMLRWECIYSDNSGGTSSDLVNLPPPRFNTMIPHFTSLHGWYMPYPERVKQAEHGFFVRSPGPASGDTANLTFRDNRYYFFEEKPPLTEPVNPIEGCSGCSQIIDGAARGWIDETDNHAPWPAAEFYDDDSINLRVYDESPTQWSVCLGEGGGEDACGEVSRDCARRTIG